MLRMEEGVMQSDREALRLYCAIAQPVELEKIPEELRYLLPSALREGWLEEQRDVYSLSSPQPSIHELRQGLVERKFLLIHLYGLRENFNADALTLVGSPRVRTQARLALVFNDSRAFMKLLSLYGDSHLVGWHPDRGHELFWHEVLGADLNSDGVGLPFAAYDELSLLIMRKSAWRGLPSLMVNLHASPELIENAALVHIRRGELAKLKTHAKNYRNSLLSQAGIALLTGDWGQAQTLFNQCFPVSSIGKMLIQRRRLEAALPLGIINAVMQGARSSIIRRWLDDAEDCLVEAQYAYLSEAESQYQRELLQLLDWLHERKLALASHEQAPPCELRSPQHLFLYILARPEYRKQGDDMESLILAAEQLVEEGELLFAHYMASYLLPDVVEESQKKRLRACCLRRIAALPRKERATQGGDTPSADAAQQEKRIFWDISLSMGSFRIESVEARLVQLDDETEKRGQPVSLEKMMKHGYDDFLTPQDIRLLEHIKRDYEHYNRPWHLDYRGYSLLADHPHLRLVQPDDSRQPLRLRRKQAQLSLRLQGDNLHVHIPTQLDYCTLAPLGNGSYQVLEDTPRLRQLTQLLGAATSDGNYTLHRKHHTRLFEALSPLCGQQSHQQKKEEAQLSVCACVSYRASCLHVTLAWRLHPDSPLYYEPSDQLEEVHLPQSAQALYIQRRKEGELLALQGVLAGCSSLQAAVPLSENSWQLHGRIASLNCLNELELLRDSGQLADILWQGSEALTLHRAPAEAIVLHSQGGSRHWLEIGASLRVDEQLIYGMEELLQLAERREGNYLPLDKQHYIFLQEEQVQQLNFLQHSLNPHGTKQRIYYASLPKLCELWTETQLPEAVKKAYAPMKQAFANTDISLEGLQAQLRDYQQLGARWLISRVRAGLGCCLADDMGLGKTLQAIALLLHEKEQGASLILAPLSLLRNWAAEIARFAPSLTVYLHHSQREPDLEAGDIYIASYGQMLSSDYIQQQDWNIIILDEAQAIKNPASQRARAAQKLQSRARVALTGTPIENNVLDLWSLMHFLNPNLLGKRSSFLERYRGQNSLEPIKELISPLMLRRQKEGVLSELPPLSEITLRVELGEEERALYENLRRRTLRQLEDKEAGNIHILSALTKLRRLCCHSALALANSPYSSKMDYLVTLIKKIHLTGHKVLIFSQFTDVLQLAKQHVEQSLNLLGLYLDGKTSAKRRSELIEQFQSPEQSDHQLFYISLKAGGTGLNLTAADYVILLDPWWNPAVESQAASRSHRWGQKHPVTLYRLICADTIEEHVMQLHDSKHQLREELNAMSQEALLELLK